VPKISASEISRKVRHASERKADRAGCSVQKVREVEVLKAARDESTRALLVYASERAVNQEVLDLPPQLKVSQPPVRPVVILPSHATHHAPLPPYPTTNQSPPKPQNFVRTDNLAFASELGTPSSPRLTSPSKRKADDDDDHQDQDQDIPWGGLPSTSTSTSTAATPSTSTTDPSLPRYVPPPPPRHPARASLNSGGWDDKGRGYDERIPLSLRGSDTPPPAWAARGVKEVGDELDGAGGGGRGGGQEMAMEMEMETEMEERGRGPRLGLVQSFGRGGRGTAAATNTTTDADLDKDADADADMLGGEERIRLGDSDADADVVGVGMGKS